MKKSTSIIVAIIVIIVVVIGGFAIFHKSSKPTTASNTGSNSSSQTNVPAVNNAVLSTKTDSSLGQYLADPSGKPLYTYNADSSGVSNCTGSCFANWPAYVDKGSTTNLPQGISTIKRTDNGQTQYTYNGMPLYYFVSDSGSTPTGDNVENFSLAKPAAASSSSSSSSSSSTPSSTPAATPAPSSSTPSYNPY